ncbi:MAG: Coenzyme F420 hydrogenase/dehydrogenase, beta subunit C-terminal domain [Lachnospiraceae bacterium]|nr:Coenzyme F420 hydrogenase/dehydrogenase, beta subunit C-terminal domain [Lachnospiraceae bacterium]
MQINRPSCENCQFKGYVRVSDLAIGDFWGIWDIAQEMDDDKGTSVVVLLRSEKGRRLFEQIEERLVVKPVTLEQASQQNQSMRSPSKAKENRGQVLEMIRSGMIAECERLFVVEKPSAFIRLKNMVARVVRKVTRLLIRKDIR